MFIDANVFEYFAERDGGHFGFVYRFFDDLGSGRRHFRATPCVDGGFGTPVFEFGDDGRGEGVSARFESGEEDAFSGRPSRAGRIGGGC